MLIAGAKGHAKEVLQIIENQCVEGPICFFDNISDDISDLFYDRYHILKSEAAVRSLFEADNRFILGLGNPYLRYKMFQLLSSWGGALTSITALSADIGKNKVFLSEGLNVMHHVAIYSDTFVGKGTLLNTACSIHHDAIVGEFCEISPGARVLGRTIIGNFCSLGTNCVILPNVKIGHHVTIGAGSVVTKNIPDYSTAVGVPARVIKSRQPEEWMP